MGERWFWQKKIEQYGDWRNGYGIQNSVVR